MNTIFRERKKTEKNTNKRQHKNIALKICNHKINKTFQIKKNNTPSFMFVINSPFHAIHMGREDEERNKKDEMFSLEDEIRKQPWINIGFIVARFKWPVLSGRLRPAKR